MRLYINIDHVATVIPSAPPSSASTAARTGSGSSVLRACRTVDCSVDPASAEEALVCGIDNGVYLEAGNITLDNLNQLLLHGNLPLSLRSYL